MAFGDGFRDRETQSSASLLAGTVFRCAVEPLENVREILIGYSDPVVLNNHQSL